MHVKGINQSKIKQNSLNTKSKADDTQFINCIYETIEVQFSSLLSNKHWNHGDRWLLEKRLKRKLLFNCYDRCQEKNCPIFNITRVSYETDA